MQLREGARLGPYEILDSIGAGGMGEVYRARDPRLGRSVAIKVLPSAFASDRERLRRFEQEARAAAAIEHPNILAVHDIGHAAEGGGTGPYIVTELLDGLALADRLRQGPLPVSKVVDYGRQILSGLAAAHARGIVHRDLKPANVFVTSDERVKILDFGIAKLTEAKREESGAATAVATRAGALLGTIGYMSPEQVCGEPADQRSDLFAVGAILHEMLAGTPAFRGETDAETTSKLLRDDPPELPVVERRIPPALVRIVRRCLEKKPAARFQTARDLKFALEGASLVSETSALVDRASSRSHLWRRGAVALVVAAALALAAFAYLRPTPVALAYHATIVPPADVGTFSEAPPLALSPDGQHLAFVATDAAGNRRLWIRRLDEPTAEPLAGTEDVRGASWSPDSRSLAVVTVEFTLKRVDIGGGPELSLADGVHPSPGTWNGDGDIVFRSVREGLFRVSESGGSAARITLPDESVGEVHSYPSFLPGGRLLYLSQRRGGATALYASSLDSADRKLVIEGVANAQYANGMLVFLRGSTLFAQPFDPRSAELRGSAKPIADQIQLSTQSFSDSTLRAGAFSVSESGALVYLRSSEVADSQLVWLDRSGARVGVLGDSAAYGDVFISRDGRLATVSVDAGTGTRDLWTYDLANGVRSRLTFDPGNEFDGVWSPNGDRVVFNTSRNGVMDLYQKTGASGVEEKLLEDGLSKFPQSWSPDGKLLAYLSVSASQGQDVFILPMDGSGEPFPFVATSFNEGVGARFSPDGRWISYTSDESGRQEIYVKPFPDTGARWRVSIDGGLIATWRGDGRELYFVEPRTNRLMVAALSFAEDGLRVDSVQPIASINPAGPRSFYDVMPDGQRFLVNSVLDGAGRAPITLVVNWRSLLAER
jgi:Tol biopolymer transport system component